MSSSKTYPKWCVSLHWLIKIDVSFVKVNVYDRLKIETPNQSKENCQNQWQQQGKKINQDESKKMVNYTFSLDK